MADLSQLSNDQLTQLYAINKNETNGALDNSTVKSPTTSASGSMQVVRGTQQDPGFGVTPSNGTPEDTAREGRDYYLAMQDKYKDPTTSAIAYNWGPGNTDAWLANGGDLSQLPPDQLKYAYHFNKNAPTANVDSPAPQQGPDLSKLSDDQLKQMYQQGQPTPVSARGQRVNAAMAALKPDSNLGSTVTGTGEAFANMASGGAGMVAGGLKSLVDLATGKSANATSDIQNIEQALTYMPRTEQGKAIAAKVQEGFGKIQSAMEQGAGTVLGPLGVPKEVSDTAADIVANIAPMLVGGEGMRPTEAIKPGMAVKDAGAAGELDKLNALNEQQTPQAPAPQMEPNAGPQRPPISVDSSGNAVDPLNPPNPGNVAGQYAQEAAERQAQFQSQDLFPQSLTDTTGQASTFDPNHLSGEEAPDSRGMLSNRRQGELQLDNNEPIRVSDSGEAFPESQVANRDTMQARTQAMQWEQPAALDPESGVPHPQEGTPSDRPAAPDEFAQAVQTLAEKDPTKFSVPADMDKAYSKYQDIVSGDMEPGTMAKKFTEAVRDQMAEDRVSNHPTIKNNQARVDSLTARLQDAQGKAGPTRQIQSQLDKAQATLEKSKENIGKAFGVDKNQLLPWEKDGAVNLYTFGHLPSVMKSIGAILKALHGVVFKTLDKLPRGVSNFDSTGKIFAQSIRDKIAKEAKKEYPTTVNEQPKQVLKGVPGLREGLKDYLPFEAREDMTPAALKDAMQQAPDLSGGAVTNFMKSNLLTGQQLAAYTKHPLVKYAVETIDIVMRESARYVRENLTGKDGLRNAVRQLNDNEFSSIWKLMQDAEGKMEYSPEQLKRAGFTDKQVEVYQKMRQQDKMNLSNLNRGRSAAGLGPIDARVAHIAGHFMGDFKRLITDSDGKVAAVIAHNLRGGVETITKRVMDQLGEGYTAGKIEMRKMTQDHNMDRYTGYMNILDDMAKRDDVVSKVVDAYRDYLTNDGQTAMKYRAAFKQKEGVIGAEGRKSWLSSIQNAKDGMTNFLHAQEAMNTWANMQEAIGKVAEFQKDPEIDAPNAKAVVTSHLDNVQRRNQGFLSDMANGMINTVSDVTGVGPSMIKGLSNHAKTGLLTMFIGLGKLSHSFVTLIQPLQGIPVVNALMRAEGSKLGLSQLMAVAKSFGSQAKFLNALATDGKGLSGFEQRALQFAKDNDTFNNGQFQFGNLTDINRNRFWSAFHNAAEFNVTGMETGTRSFTYMYYSHMLKDLGMDEKEIFPTAHNAMRDVMVDYNSWERPGVFGKMGFLGDLTAMLTRYKFNQIDQFARGSKYAAQGQFGPMAAIMSTSMMAAGVRGVMAYTLANDAVQQVTKWASENGLMQKPTSIDEMLLHFLHGKNETMSNMVKFGLPSGLGLNLTGSLSHADDIPNDPLGALMPQADPMAEYTRSAYQFLHDPNKTTAKSALYGMSPNSLRGPEENAMFTDKNGNYFNPQNQELQTKRSPQAQAVRNFGFRPLNEANESLTTQVNTSAAGAQASVKADINQKILRAIDSINPSIQKGSPEFTQAVQSIVRPHIQQYIANNGDPTEIATEIQKHLGLGQNRTAAERAQGIPTEALQSSLNYQRYQNLK